MNKTIQRLLLVFAEHMPFGRPRNKLYRLAGVKTGENSRIAYGVRVAFEPSKLVLGKNTEINQNVYFHLKEKVLIGENSTLSPGVQIITSANPNAPYNELKNLYPPISKEVIIGRNVWIGTNAIILPGVKIGDMSVVGAGAVVTEDVPSFCVVVGVPAKIVKHLQK